MENLNEYDSKPVPNQPAVISATDANRRHNANLAPQGTMQKDAPDDLNWTPEGDHEQVPNIPPSATDPE